MKQTMSESQHVFNFCQKVRAATHRTDAQPGPVCVTCSRDRTKAIVFCFVGGQTVSVEVPLPAPWSKEIRQRLEHVFNTETP